MGTCVECGIPGTSRKVGFSKKMYNIYDVAKFVFSFDILPSLIPESYSWPSPVYSDEEASRRWYIELRKDQGTEMLYVSFHMQCSSHSEEDEIVNCSFEVIGCDGKAEATAQYMTLFSCKCENSPYEFCGLSSHEVVSLPPIYHYAGDIKKVIVTTKFHSLEPTLERPSCDRRNKLTTDILSLLTNKNFSDVLIQADGVDIPAHKAILTARSPVLAVMCRHDDRVVIEDFSAEVVRQFLEFLYGEQQPEFTSERAVELLKASEKYEVRSLKETCENYLSEHLQISNALEMLVLADTFRAPSLKQCALDFVRSNIKTFKENEQLMPLPENLLTEVLLKERDC